MANVTRYTPSYGMTPLSEAMDRLFRDAFTWPRGLDNAFAQPTGLGMNSNLYETGDSYVMQVALPGVKADELEISARENVLALRGKTNVEAPEGAKAIWVGLNGAEFRQEIALPGEVNADAATASYSDGILTLTLPKSERSKVRTIRIGGGTAPAIDQGK